jgi:hypothetical protein
LESYSFSLDLTMVHWFFNLIGLGNSPVPEPAQDPAAEQDPVPSGTMVEAPIQEAPVIPSDPDVANDAAAAVPRRLPEADDSDDETKDSDETKDEVGGSFVPDADISSLESTDTISAKPRKEKKVTKRVAKHVPKRKTLVPVKYPLKANGQPHKRSVTSEQLQKLIAVKIKNVLCSEYGSYQGLTRKEISEAVKYTSNGNSFIDTFKTMVWEKLIETRCFIGPREFNEPKRKKFQATSKLRNRLRPL